MFRILKLGNILDTQGLPSQSNIGMGNVPTTQGPQPQFDKQRKTMKKIWNCHNHMFVATMEVVEVGSKIHVTCRMFGMFVMSLWNHVYGLS